MNDPQKWYTERAALDTFKAQYSHLTVDEMESLCREQLETGEYALHHVLWYGHQLALQQKQTDMVSSAMNWLSRFPDSVLLVHVLGKAWVHLGETERSEKLIRAALKVHPNEFMLWCDMAEVHLRNNRLKAAYECCQYVLHRDKEFTAALLLMERMNLNLMASSEPQYTSRIQGMIKMALESRRDQAHGRKILSIYKEAGWVMQVVFILFTLGQRLCGTFGVLVWIVGLMLLYWGGFMGAEQTWQNWIIAPQLLIVTVIAGWGMMFAMGTFLHQSLNKDRARPLWNHQWLWTLVPILLWSSLTSIRYCMGDSEHSFAIDFVRSLAFCSIVPIFVWRKQAARRHPIAIFIWLAWCAIVGLFICGGLAHCASCYGIGFVLSSSLAVIYMLKEWKK